jgi:hypothetical protein
MGSATIGSRPEALQHPPQYTARSKNLSKNGQQAQQSIMGWEDPRCVHETVRVLQLTR